MLTAFRAWTTSQLRVEEEAKAKNSHELKAFYEDRYLSILSPETSTILEPIFSDIWNSSSENGEFNAWLCTWKVREWQTWAMKGKSKVARGASPSPWRLRGWRRNRSPVQSFTYGSSHSPFFLRDMAEGRLCFPCTTGDPAISRVTKCLSVWMDDFCTVNTEWMAEGKLPSPGQRVTRRYPGWPSVYPCGWMISVHHYTK